MTTIDMERVLLLFMISAVLVLPSTIKSRLKCTFVK